MRRLEVAAPGLAVEAWLEEGDVVPLGVEVQFHPGIPQAVRRMCLEQVLRHWSRETGTVSRTGVVLEKSDAVYLAGWTLASACGGDVVGMRIAFADNVKEKEKTA